MLKEAVLKGGERLSSPAVPRFLTTSGLSLRENLHAGLEATVNLLEGGGKRVKLMIEESLDNISFNESDEFIALILNTLMKEIFKVKSNGQLIVSVRMVNEERLQLVLEDSTSRFSKCLVTVLQSLLLADQPISYLIRLFHLHPWPQDLIVMISCLKILRAPYFHVTRDNICGMKVTLSLPAEKLNKMKRKTVDTGDRISVLMTKQSRRLASHESIRIQMTKDLLAVALLYDDQDKRKSNVIARLKAEFENFFDFWSIPHYHSVFKKLAARIDIHVCYFAVKEMDLLRAGSEERIFYEINQALATDERTVSVVLLSA
eukprot:TRINITY_DN12128_c0_g1_i1.p1 TRINITY_DN12128_c0_g1~~TRINITY_DN12128_c0_g1_i1.p1  ORF type:complete len:317 (+),score=47.80 TRINITY_DN12128_c0_g1_i1:527-1477(+)